MNNKKIDDLDNLDNLDKINSLDDLKFFSFKELFKEIRLYIQITLIADFIYIYSFFNANNFVYKVVLILLLIFFTIHEVKIIKDMAILNIEYQKLRYDIGATAIITKGVINDIKKEDK